MDSKQTKEKSSACIKSLLLSKIFPGASTNPVASTRFLEYSFFDDSLYALGSRTGSKLWSFSVGGFIRSSPAVINGVVYVGSYDKSLYALDARTGNKLWSFSTGDSINSSPTVVNGVVYVGSFDGRLYAQDVPIFSHMGRLVFSHFFAYARYDYTPAHTQKDRE